MVIKKGICLISCKIESNFDGYDDLGDCQQFVCKYWYLGDNNCKNVFETVISLRSCKMYI